MAKLSPGQKLLLMTNTYHKNRETITNYLYVILILITTTQLHACNSEKELDKFNSTENTKDTTIMDFIEIKITIGSDVLKATLNNSETTKDFISLLPLTITLDDYAATEKICYLSKKLSTEGAPTGIDPEIGDITYYAPWGNLAIFYKDFGYANGLIKLGVIKGDIELLQIAGSIEAKIELIK